MSGFPMRRLFIWVICLVPIGAIFFSLFQLSWTHVQISLDPVWQGENVLIKGETSVPDRALFSFEITDPETEELFATGIAVVKKGMYKGEVNGDYLPKRNLLVTVRFEVSYKGLPQPPVVVARFGSEGERISGENARIEGSRKWLEISKLLSVDSK